MTTQLSECRDMTDAASNYVRFFSEIGVADVALVGGKNASLVALADGPSPFRASQLSSHAAAAMWLLERLTSAPFSVYPDTSLHLQPTH